ncbi:MAG: hypothetical protein Q9187_001639 [Circinaria calcarea]
MVSNPGVRPAPTGFLDLPPEIRHMVYRKLLSTSETYQGYRDFDPPRSDYQLYPSILRVNHRIYQETHRILYDENAWIILKTVFDNSGDASYPWDHHPIKLAKEVPAVHRQALTIIIKKRETSFKQRLFTFILGPESLERFIMCMLQTITNLAGDQSTRDLSVQLLLARSRAHSRNQLQRLLLTPFFDVQGFTAVSIVGNVDCDFGIHLFTQMIGPMDNAGRIKTIVQNLVSRGHAASSQGRTFEACIVWRDAIRYTLHFNSLCHAGLGPASAPVAQAIKAQLVEVRFATYLDIGRCLIQAGRSELAIKHYQLTPKLFLRPPLTRNSYDHARAMLYGSLGHALRRDDQLAHDIMERSFFHVCLDVKLCFKLIRECEELVGPRGFTACPITEAYFDGVRKEWLKKSWKEIMIQIRATKTDSGPGVSP